MSSVARMESMREAAVQWHNRQNQQHARLLLSCSTSRSGMGSRVACDEPGTLPSGLSATTLSATRFASDGCHGRTWLRRFWRTCSARTLHRDLRPEPSLRYTNMRRGTHLPGFTVSPSKQRSRGGRRWMRRRGGRVCRAVSMCAVPGAERCGSGFPPDGAGLGRVRSALTSGCEQGAIWMRASLMVAVPPLRCSRSGWPGTSSPAAGMLAQGPQIR
jgi:hypothetical protein